MKEFADINSKFDENGVFVLQMSRKRKKLLIRSMRLALQTAKTWVCFGLEKVNIDDYQTIPSFNQPKEHSI